MNDVAFNAMYVRLFFKAPAAAEVFHTKGINNLRLLGGLNVNHVNSLVKFIHRRDRSDIGSDLSETIEHHLILVCHICKYWRQTLRESKTCAELVKTGDLFEEAERQMDLKTNWDNDKEIFHDFTDAN